MRWARLNQIISRCHKHPFKVVFVYYAPEGAALSMPIAVLSAVLKQDFNGIEIEVVAINKTYPPEKYSVNWFCNHMAALRPDLIAVSCMSPHWNELKEYLTAVKLVNPRTPILVGGYQPTLAPEETITHPAVDFICVGDGEEPITQLVRRLVDQGKDSVKGLWEKLENGQVLRSEAAMTKDLNVFPFPDYSVFEKDGTLAGLGLSVFGPQGQFILPVMTGRGCPYKCTYCCNTPLLEMFKGQGYIRKYDILPLINELERLRDRYRVDYFEFWDELFMVNIKYTLDFFKEYKERIRIPFSINSRVERMDEMFCQAAAEAGCQNIWFGIESGSEQYRVRNLGRKMTNEQIIIAARNAKKFGINRLTFNIVGMPSETIEDARETLRLNQQIQPEFFYFFTYIPLEGTPLYKVAEAQNLLLDKKLISSDYLENQRKNEFRLNIREHEGGMDQQEFQDICEQMKEFQTTHSSLEFYGQTNDFC